LVWLLQLPTGVMAELRIIDSTGPAPSQDIRALQEDLLQRERELSVLYRLNKSLSSGYLEHLLSLIVNLTAELVDCKICSIMLLDQDSNELVVRATQSLDDEYLKKNPVKVDQSLSGIAILERRTVQSQHISQNERFCYRPMAERLGLHSLLSVPMMVKAKPIGVINYYTETARSFSDDEVRFLQAIANQAAVAIERHQLKEQAKASQRALEERKLIERAKGILMERKQLSEQQAYQRLRKSSMSSRKSMREIAEAIILAEEL
jgi:signal transduction protein with GAF and PtsI domain